MAISMSVKLLVRQRADFLCEYCHSSEEISAARFEIDHIQPRSRGGSDSVDNLALACQRCNAHHYNFIQGKDPETLNNVDLFHPRQQVWNQHFIWSQDGCKVSGVTEIGRATVQRLDLNDEVRGDGEIMRSRLAWVKAGWHPPVSDLRQLI
ncbi:MAG: HNH endonuclease [Pseudanabaena frigida]|uniref:HNH endonuclease n=1 Tax=Pseudanabaena frigida TaxID=945775 RepID=A0A2W4W894_9CYAN|nr:MAG: HNH endonuclease [Pseudanabaena frigida]